MTEQQRRAAALERFVCPDHGTPLEESADVDELGQCVTYWCFGGLPDDGPHVFGSGYDGEAGYYPVDREEATP